ncbi:MAG: hypothetical protein A2073_01990 [Deltaproteobacteria bacterium GWC2_42_11]|nr:MAG: hypothetical protein A2073_01990 [Deltaproteobacteria bacterium GWC2_42_11]
MRKILKRPFLLIILLSILIVTPSISSPFNKEERTSGKPVVYFGAIMLYTPLVMYERYQPFIDYLTANTPYEFRLKVRKDYEDVARALNDGTFGIALLGGVTYVMAKEEGLDILPILVPLNPSGKPTYRSVIITRRDNDEINDISDLKGRSVAFTSRLGTSGRLGALYHLYKTGITIRDLSRSFHLRYHDSVVREVLNGRYDAGVVMDSVAESYKDKGIKSVFVSQPLPALPIVVSKDTSPELVDSVKAALLRLNPKNPSHRKMMEGWDMVIRNGFVEATESNYKEIEDMVRYLKEKGVYFRF